LTRKEGIRSAHFGGLCTGYAYAIRFIFQGFIFYIATIFVVNKGEKPEEAYISVFILLMAALGCG